jgi:hypothetical protein
LRRIEQRRLSTPAHGGAGGGGEPPTDQRYPRTGTRSPYPTRGYTPGSRGAARKKTIIKLRSGRLKRGLEGPGILAIPPAAYPAQQSATTAGVKRRA